MKKILLVLLAIAVILGAVFLAGRYGWRLGGFRACQGAGIYSIEATKDNVHIVGFYPGSFPQGFCGYYARQSGETLYVGFRFSGLFGAWETGEFDINIPVEGEIREVILKTAKMEAPIWAAGQE